MYSHQHLKLHEKRKKNHVSTFNKHWQLVLQELFKVTSKFLGGVWVNFPQPVGISKGCTWCMLCQRDPLYIFNNACHESGSTAGHSVREVRQLKKNWRQHLGDKQTKKRGTDGKRHSITHDISLVFLLPLGMKQPNEIVINLMWALCTNGYENHESINHIFTTCYVSWIIALLM